MCEQSAISCTSQGIAQETVRPLPVLQKESSRKFEDSKTSDGEDCQKEGEKYEVADIFRRYWKGYCENNTVASEQRKVVNDILGCRTGLHGYHISVCDTCGHMETYLNSCHNRHCPKCQGSKKLSWVQARIDDLLPVPYYHVVFTLPDKIFPLCLFNRKVIYDLLFHSSAETLKTFGEDPKWLGGQTGFFGVLHTWGQQLVMHPHIHYVVVAGGINEESGEWVFPKYEKNDFLFPVHALSKVFRGKFIQGMKEAYRKGELKFPGNLKEIETQEDFEKWLYKLVSTQWVVYSKAPFAGPESVVSYVGRYTHKVAISNSRIISIDEGKIRFSYKNYKRKDEVEDYRELWEEMELPAEEFIRRFLYHIMPPGYHRIRYFGFLGNGQKTKLQEIWEELVFEQELKLENIETKGFDGMPCPECEIGKLMPVLVVDGYGRKIKGSFSELVAINAMHRKLRKWTEIEEWNTS